MSSIWTTVFSLIKTITGDVDVKNKGTLQDQIDADSKTAFKRYYGLVAAKTEFPNDGSIIVTNNEATITTKFTTSGGVKTITEKIVVTETGKTYTKTTTITPASGSTNKKITEVYE